MPASTWRDDLERVTRPDDGEGVGYLRRVGESRWEPLNLLGIALGGSASREAAMEQVVREGMLSISQVWWCRAPRPLSEPISDARAVDPAEAWERMVVVELTRDRAMLRPVYAWPEESGYLVSVDLPAHDIVIAYEPVDEV